MDTEKIEVGIVVRMDVLQVLVNTIRDMIYEMRTWGSLEGQREFRETTLDILDDYPAIRDQFEKETSEATEDMNKWGELESFAQKHPEILCTQYMFMGKTKDGISLYKDINTRRYLNIRDGQCYFYRWWEDKYTAISESEAIQWVLS
jgi:uncharacterized protein YwqG